MDEEILGLRSRFWSERDPEGRGFAPLADAYRRAGELEEALELLEDGIDRLPEFTPGHVVAGRVHRDRGRPDDARGAFSRVLDLDPENVVALRALGELAEEAGRTDEALEHFRRLRALEPEDPELARRIEALEAGPEPVEPAGELGDGAEPAPSEAPEPAVAEDGEMAEDVVTATMAELYVRQGLTGKAVEVYGRLVERDPENPRFRERLAELESAAEEADGRAEDAGAAAPPAGLDRSTRARDSHEDADEIAESMAAGPAEDDEVRTPFAWREEEPRESGPAAPAAPAAPATPAAPADEGESLGRYFDVLLSWVPGAVPIESLAPDGEGGTDRQGGAVGEGVVPIESLAPDGEAVVPGEDVVPIESLAPDEPPS